MSCMVEATVLASSSDSRAQGPPMSSNGCPEPTTSGGTRLGVSMVTLFHHGSTLFSGGQGGADEIPEQRVGFHRFGLELRMKLAAEEPGVIGDFDDLDQVVVRGGAGDGQPRLFPVGR
jgi:hypothetical protein